MPASVQLGARIVGDCPTVMGDPNQIHQALTNVCKHSSGREARLALGYDRGELRITVDDPGDGGGPGAGDRAGGTAGTASDAAAGPAPAAAPPAGGRGIRGMRERLLQCHGTFAEVLERRGELARAYEHMKEALQASRPGILKPEQLKERLSSA